MNKNFPIQIKIQQNCKISNKSKINIFMIIIIYCVGNYAIANLKKMVRGQDYI